jgi:hypothetical protein
MQREIILIADHFGILSLFQFLLRGEPQSGVSRPIRHEQSPGLGPKSGAWRRACRHFGLSSDLPRLWINVAFPPVSSAFFGAKAAIDSGRSGGLDVQTLVLLIEGEAANFFLAGVVECSYDC